MDFLITLKELDTKLLLAIQSIHSYWLDEFMYHISGKTIWIPLYVFLIYLLWKKYNRRVWKSIVILVIGIIVSDQVASSIFKPLVLRPRPCHEISLEGKIRIVHNHCGGMYGFFSSHASTTFTIAIFFTLLFWKSQRFVSILLCWATFISLSRIYLGVHYPGDVLAGMFCGFIVGWLSYKADQRILMQ